MEDYRAFAEGLVKEAGVRLKGAVRGTMRVSYKGGDPRDLVTNIDIEISDFLKEKIMSAFPDHRVYSEEDAAGHTAHMQGFEWALDPIEGTGNFVHRIPHFSTCVCLLKDGEPLAGAVYNPMTDELFSFDEKGAFFDGAPMRVSEVTDPKDAQALYMGDRREPMWEWNVAVYRDLVASFNKHKALGSANLDLAFLAAGRAEVVLYGAYSMPDGAAGVGLVRAAGGEVYSVTTGKPLAKSAKREVIVATANKALYEKIQLYLHTELLPKG